MQIDALVFLVEAGEVAAKKKCPLPRPVWFSDPQYSLPIFLIHSCKRYSVNPARFTPLAVTEIRISITRFDAQKRTRRQNRVFRLHRHIAIRSAIGFYISLTRPDRVRAAR